MSKVRALQCWVRDGGYPTGHKALRAQNQQIMQALEALRQENAALRTGQQGISQLAASIGELAKNLGEKKEPKLLIDNKGLGRPEPCDNQEDSFRRWARSVSNLAVGIFGKSFGSMMEWAAEQESPIASEESEDVDLTFGDPDAENYVADAANKVDQLYRVLHP